MYRIHECLVIDRRINYTRTMATIAIGILTLCLRLVAYAVVVDG